MPNFTQDWFYLGEKVLNLTLEPIKGKDNLVFMEIGSFEGRSAIWMLENILTGKNTGIICIDTFKGSNEFNENRVDVTGLKERFIENMKPYEGRYELIKGDSSDVLRTSDFDNKIDLVYIDGSHEASDVLTDLCLSYKLLKQGGYLVLDDYMWHYNNKPAEKTPKPAIDGFMECYKGKIKALQVTWKIVILQKI